MTFMFCEKAFWFAMFPSDTDDKELVDLNWKVHSHKDYHHCQ